MERANPCGSTHPSMQSDWSPCASSGGGSRYLCGGLELEVEGAEDTTQEGVQQREGGSRREGAACLPASVVSWEGGSDGASLASAVRAHTGTRPCDPELLILVLLGSSRIRRGSKGERDRGDVHIICR